MCPVRVPRSEEREEEERRDTTFRDDGQIFSRVNRTHKSLVSGSMTDPSSSPVCSEADLRVWSPQRKPRDKL